MKLAQIFEVVGLTVEQIRQVAGTPAPADSLPAEPEPVVKPNEKPRPLCPYCKRPVGHCQKVRATGLSLFL
jgi:hypothetical protein